MKIERMGDKVVLALDQDEVLFLTGIFSRVKDEYQTEPSVASPEMREAWYPEEFGGKPACPEGEKEDWNEQLFEFRTDQGREISNWIAYLSEAKPPVKWMLDFSSADTLIAVLNDYRLLSASRMGIDEEVLEHDFQSVENPAIRRALFEIHFLAWMIECVIEEVSEKPTE